MKRKICKILSVGVLLGAVFAQVSAPAHAHAENANAAAELFLPSSYEEYLPLNKPSGVAVSAQYIAVADGQNVYVYDRAQNEYSLYVHPNENVTKLQFSYDGSLYFSDASTALYTLTPATLNAEKTALQCSTFTLWEDTVYFTTISEYSTRISSAKTSDLTKTQTLKDGISSKPAIAQDGGEIYYTDSGRILQKLSDFRFAEVLTQNTNVESLAVKNGFWYYTDEAGNFYAYDSAVQDGAEEENPKLLDVNCSAVTAADDGYVYVVKGKTIRRYHVGAQKFDTYEISADSPAENRLCGATDTLLKGNLLFVNDADNSRLSVSDLQDGTTYTLPVSAGAYMLAADSKSALVASAHKAELYDLTQKSLLASFDFDGDLCGVTNVYGKYYLVTKGNRYCRVDYNQTTGLYELKSVARTSSAPRLLSSDVYGSLYVACADNRVYAYKESEFLNPEIKKEFSDSVCAVPAETTKIAVDFNRNVYALVNSDLLKITGELQTEFSLAKSLVYTQDDQTPVSSFTFDVEENQAYLLYAGNFIVKTDELGLPTLKTIPVSGADEAVFDDGDAVFSVVKIQASTLFIRFDIEKFSGASVFPYLSYTRETDEKTALKLGEADEFNIIAVFDPQTRAYSTALVEKTSCAEIPESEFLKPAENFTENSVGYVTNPLPLYKYPYLTDLLTVMEIPKHAEVTVLGQIDDLDYKYYLIEYEENGATHKGYLPQAYVSDFDGRPPQAHEATFGEKQSDLDSVWRAAFILLGFACICILTDYLILRKKK